MQSKGRKLYRESVDIREETKTENQKINKKINITNLCSNLNESAYMLCVSSTRMLLNNCKQRLCDIVTCIQIPGIDSSICSFTRQFDKIKNVEYIEKYNDTKFRDDKFAIIYGKSAKQRAESDMYEHQIIVQKKENEINRVCKDNINLNEKIRVINRLCICLENQYENLYYVLHKNKSLWDENDIMTVYVCLEIYRLLSELII